MPNFLFNICLPPFSVNFFLGTTATPMIILYSHIWYGSSIIVKFRIQHNFNINSLIYINLNSKILSVKNVFCYRLSLVSTDSLEIYATPRPLNDATRKKFCVQERNTCRVYRRLMLLAWRRSRDSLKTLNEFVTKQEVQVNIFKHVI